MSDRKKILQNSCQVGFWPENEGGGLKIVNILTIFVKILTLFRSGKGRDFVRQEDCNLLYLKMLRNSGPGAISLGFLRKAGRFFRKKVKSSKF